MEEIFQVNVNSGTSFFCKQWLEAATFSCGILYLIGQEKCIFVTWKSQGILKTDGCCNHAYVSSRTRHQVVAIIIFFMNRKLKPANVPSGIRKMAIAKESQNLMIYQHRKGSSGIFLKGYEKHHHVIKVAY